MEALLLRSARLPPLPWDSGSENSLWNTYPRNISLGTRAPLVMRAITLRRATSNHHKGGLYSAVGSDLLKRLSPQWVPDYRSRPKAVFVYPEFPKVKLGPHDIRTPGHSELPRRVPLGPSTLISQFSFPCPTTPCYATAPLIDNMYRCTGVPGGPTRTMDTPCIHP